MLARILLTWFGHVLCWLVMKVTVIGRVNVPREGPLIIIGNHFSLLEPILMGLYLGVRPTFMASDDLMAHPLARIVINAFRPIQVKRGQVDRQALRAARSVLEKAGMLVVFPEGGIDEEIRDWPVEKALAMPFDRRTSRRSAQLIRARDGVAWLAVQTKARILPVAYLHTEQVIPNFRRWRRTAIEIRIGQPFGPYSLPSELRGQDRRVQLAAITDEMMFHLAALLPPANRGPYRLPE